MNASSRSRTSKSTKRRPSRTKQAKKKAAVRKKPLREVVEALTETNQRLRKEISRRKRLEKRLAREERLLHVLMDTLPDTIYFKDAESRFTRINRAHAESLGLKDPKQAIGKTDADFFPAKRARESRKDERRILAKAEPLIGKIENRSHTGSQRWVSTTKVPLHDENGVVTGLVGLSRDITNVRATQEALDRERSFMNTLLENLPDAIFFKDRDCRFVIINKYCAQKFGLTSPDDAIGKTDFDVFTEEHARQAYEDEQRVMKTGEALVGVEEKETWRDKPDTWVLTTKMPWRDKRGKIIGTFGLARDITVVRHYRDALQEANELLEKRVQERTQDLQEANVRLEQRLGQLDFLTRSTYRLAQVIDLSSLYPAITTAFLSRFSEAEACMCVRDGIRFRSVHATRALDSPAARKSSEKAIAEFAKRRLRTPLMYRNWTKDRHLSPLKWDSVRHLPCYILIPLLAENEILGCLQIFTSAAYADIFAREKPLLATLATHAAMCQSNAEYYREVGMKARLEAELDAARNIQKSFTPMERPSIPHVNLKGFYQPAYEVSGDYLDYFQAPDGSWVIVIADVCGKGIPAALLMTVLRSTFRTEAQRSSSAKDLVCAVDKSMAANMDERSFITAICLLVSPNGRRMSYVRAGHPRLIKLGHNGTETRTIDSGGLALGLVRDGAVFTDALEEVSVPLEPGDRFLLYTDGLIEAVDAKMRTYGMDRLCALLGRTQEDEPQAILTRVIDDVKEFIRETPFHDDLTMLALTVE
ncbi:MAG: SpoIIE family protein phosphatase [Chitinivibrionales bacterium]|nr:SpoIIE family protein phosphatase [Chitinivibrionales bacterium]MBD3394227.1 SpoIIE family protein phosphatase [Chitinivibrionales bacterium]